MNKVDMTKVKSIKDKLESHLTGINLISAIRDRVEPALANIIEPEKAKDILDKKILVDELNDKEIIALFRVIFNQIKDPAFNPSNFVVEDNEENEEDNKLFNEDFKMRFIEEHRTEDGKEYADATKRVIRLLFGNTAEIEKFYNKDLYELDNNQFEEVLMGLESKSLRSLQNSVSTIERYIDFAIKKKKAKKVNIASQYHSQERVKQFLNKEAEEKMVFTKVDIDALSDYADNSQDGVILNLIFDGVSHKNKFLELRHITINDVDKDNLVINIPQLVDEDTGEIYPPRQVPISSHTLRMIERAMEDEKYVSSKEGSKTVRKYKIAESDYILRGLRNNFQIKWENVNQRILRISERQGYPYLNATTIAYSGQIHYAMEEMDKGVHIDDAIRSIMKRFKLGDNESAFFYLKARIEKARKLLK